MKIEDWGPSHWFSTVFSNVQYLFCLFVSWTGVRFYICLFDFVIEMIWCEDLEGAEVGSDEGNLLKKSGVMHITYVTEARESAAWNHHHSQAWNRPTSSPLVTPRTLISSCLQSRFFYQPFSCSKAMGRACALENPKLERTGSNLFVSRLYSSTKNYPVLMQWAVRWKILR